MTLVSVIIPTLNRPELLKRAITSIYNQAFKFNHNSNLRYEYIFNK